MNELRNFFAARVLGLQTENTVTALKLGLFAAGLISDPTALIDTVMIDSIEHFYELIGGVLSTES